MIISESVQLPLSGEQLEVHFRLNTSHVDTPPLFKQSLRTMAFARRLAIMPGGLGRNTSHKARHNGT
jgi:hypothetical protein